MKLQIRGGDKTKKGVKRLTSVIYINAGVKLGLPSRLKLLTIRFKKKPCKSVRINVTITLASGDKLEPIRIPIRLLTAGSNKIGVMCAGRLRKIPRHRTKPIAETKIILTGENFRCWFIIIVFYSSSFLIRRSNKNRNRSEERRVGKERSSQKK